MIGADGVVRNISNPVCASKVASQLFLDRAATPPLEEGTSRCLLLFPFGQHALRGRDFVFSFQSFNC